MRIKKKPWNNLIYRTKPINVFPSRLWAVILFTKDETNCNMLPLALRCSQCVVADFSEASGIFLFNVIIKHPIHFIRSSHSSWLFEVISGILLCWVGARLYKSFLLGHRIFLLNLISMCYRTKNKVIPFCPAVKAKPYPRWQPVKKIQ